MRSSNNGITPEVPRRRDDWSPAVDHVRPTREPTAAEAEAIAEVIAIAAEFDGSGAMLLAATQATTPRQRRLAILFTAPTDPAFAHLRRLLDAILATDRDLVVTKHGVFTRAELSAVSAKVERVDGTELWCFPVAYPKGEPFYRGADKRGPRHASFTAGRIGDDAERPREWWEGSG